MYDIAAAEERYERAVHRRPYRRPFPDKPFGEVAGIRNTVYQRVEIRDPEVISEGKYMISVSKELKVNPDQPGLTPLSRSDLWKGLKMKAENALPFVQGMSKCDVVEKTDNGLIRDIEFQGKPARERITFYPEKKVVFLRLSGDADGIIVNEILGADDDLRVRFSFAFQLTDAESGSPEEEVLRKAMETAYVAAVDATLNGIRNAKASGAL